MTSTGKKLIGECGMRWSTKYNIEKKESFVVMLHKETLRSKKIHRAFNNAKVILPTLRIEPQNLLSNTSNKILHSPLVMNPQVLNYPNDLP